MSKHLIDIKKTKVYGIKRGSYTIRITKNGMNKSQKVMKNVMKKCLFNNIHSALESLFPTTTVCRSRSACGLILTHINPEKK